MSASQPPSSLRTRTQRSTRPTTASSGSQTITSTSIPAPTRLILRGHAEPTPPSRVQWADSVIDNENLGRKSSKVCCIYHRPHDPEAESGSDSSSSDSSSESSGDDLDRATVRRSRARRKQRDEHEHGEGCSGDHGNGGDGGEGEEKGGKGKGKKVINAYERMPKYTEAGRKQAGDG